LLTLDRFGKSSDRQLKEAKKPDGNTSQKQREFLFTEESIQGGLERAFEEVV
jgi:hypothetical protein